MAFGRKQRQGVCRFGKNRQSINRQRSLFHLRTVDEIRASPAKREENASLYSYNPLTVKLVRIAPVAGNKMKAVAKPDAKSVNTQARPQFSAS
jgi:hypothetical protein